MSYVGVSDCTVPDYVNTDLPPESTFDSVLCS